MPTLAEVRDRFTPTALRILLLYGFVSLVTLSAPPALKGFIAEQLLLTPGEAFFHKPWQLVTGIFFGQITQVVFLGFLFYSLSVPLEAKMGRKGYLRSMVIASLLGSLSAALVGMLKESWRSQIVLVGSDPIFVATLAAFAAFYGDQQMMIWGAEKPFPGWVLCWFFLALSLLMDLIPGRVPEFAGSLVAIAVGFHVGTGKKFAPILRLRALIKEVQVTRAKKRYKVMDGGKAGGGMGKGTPKEPRWMN